MAKVSRLRQRAFTTTTAFGGTAPGRRVAAVVESLHRAFENDNSDHTTNGEAWLLTRLAPLRPAAVLDVGANVGSWSIAAIGQFESATVHAFEPIQDTYQRLVANVGSASPSRFVANNVALSSTAKAEMPMWLGHESKVASAVHRGDVDSGEQVAVESLDGDEYCASHGIEHIDLLKIDTEGHDLEVLRGFQGMLRRGAVDVIQFEFTLFAVYARTWLGDFYSLLEPFGYSIGKLYPTWVDWRAYDAHDERFFRCNFVAVCEGSAARRVLD